MGKCQKGKERAQALECYRVFDRQRNVTVRVMLIGFVAQLANLLRLFILVDYGKKTEVAAMYALVIYLFYTAAVIIVCIRIGKIDKKLRQKLYEGASSIDGATVFGKFWTDFEMPGEEKTLAWLPDTRLSELERYKNTLTMVLWRNKHEFIIEADPEKLSLMADEETDSPVEKSLPMSSFTDHGQIFETIKSFVEENS